MIFLVTGNSLNELAICSNGQIHMIEPLRESNSLALLPHREHLSDRCCALINRWLHQDDDVWFEGSGLLNDCCVDKARLYVFIKGLVDQHQQGFGCCPLRDTDDWRLSGEDAKRYPVAYMHYMNYLSGFYDTYGEMNTEAWMSVDTAGEHDEQDQGRLSKTTKWAHFGICPQVDHRVSYIHVSARAVIGLSLFSQLDVCQQFVKDSLSKEKILSKYRDDWDSRVGTDLYARVIADPCAQWLTKWPETSAIKNASKVYNDMFLGLRGFNHLVKQPIIGLSKYSQRCLHGIISTNGVELHVMVRAVQHFPSAVLRKKHLASQENNIDKLSASQVNGWIEQQGRVIIGVDPGHKTLISAVRNHSAVKPELPDVILSSSSSAVLGPGVHSTSSTLTNLDLQTQHKRDKRRARKARRQAKKKEAKSRLNQNRRSRYKMKSSNSSSSAASSSPSSSAAPSASTVSKHGRRRAKAKQAHARALANNRQSIYTLSNRHYQDMTGHKAAAKLRSKWRSSSNVLHDIDQHLTEHRATARKCTFKLGVYIDYLKVILNDWDSMWLELSKKKWDRLNFWVYQRSQQAFDKIARDVVGVNTSPGECVVLWGNGGFAATSKGHASAPNIKLRRELTNRGLTIILSDEFRSSKLTACCHELSQFVSQTQRLSQSKIKKITRTNLARAAQGASPTVLNENPCVKVRGLLYCHHHAGQHSTNPYVCSVYCTTNTNMSTSTAVCCVLSSPKVQSRVSVPWNRDVSAAINIVKIAFGHARSVLP
jgi:hypothetical protein